MFRYDIKFLEEKLGKFDIEYAYPRKSLIGGSLIYVEKNTKDELEDEINQIKRNNSINPTYIWGFVNDTNAIYFTKSFGENKVFIYNPKSMKKTEFVKGKLKVLKNLKKETIDDLFDHKAVFDYFYKKLWDLRLELGKEIRDKNKIPDNIALMEAQHIIDRIIFTYFICERRLISVKDYGPITGKELFSDIIGQIPEEQIPGKWYYLKQLFFEQFANPNSKDLDFGGDVIIKAPYLNGGLFRPKTICGISEEDLKIEYDWNNIFGPLDKYSWIIEDEINDLEGEYEGNLTPEIIGHIYEKFVISIGELHNVNLEELKISSSGDLKKGKKDIGAYYTPEPITDYIVRNTILPYILEQLGIMENIDFDAFVNNSDKKTLEKALNLLTNMTVCDPACGSGAFIIKAGELLLEYIQILYKVLGTSQIDRYSLKKNIIINNLYGVDIQEGAVEICKLRLWLWLISSAKNDYVEPLPNIEYNFIVGNSLVGWTNEKIDQNVLIRIDESHIKPLISLKVGLKSKQKQEINNSIELLKKTDIKSYAKAISHLKSLYSYSSGEDAEILKDTIEWTKAAIYEQINGIFYDHIQSKKCNISQTEYENLNPFHWQVDYNSIFENGGFDIVIGNPPYIRVHKMPVIEKKFLKSVYMSPYKDFDIYICFMERVCNIIKYKGYLGFINPDKYLIREYGSFIRIFLLNNFKALSIINISHCDVFDSISVYPVINIFKRLSSPCRFEKKLMHNFDSNIKIMHINSVEEIYLSDNHFLLSQSTIYDTEDYKIEIYIDPYTREIFNSIEQDSVCLDELSENFCGTPRAKDYYKWGDIITDEQPNNNFCKYLVCRNIAPYRINWGIKINSVKKTFFSPFVSFNSSLISKDKWKNFKEKNKLIVRGNDTRLTCALGSEGYAGIGLYFLINLKVDPLLLLSLLNSKLMTFYYKKKYSSAHISGGFLSINGIHLDSLPIKVPANKDTLIILSSYMQFLNSDEDILNSNEDLIIFINENLIDSLIYELYFANETKTNLNNLIEPLLVGINELNSNSDKMSIIKDVYIKINKSKKIRKEIEQIKDLDWVRYIEKID